MEKCKFEKYLVDYLNEDLPLSIQSEIEHHLKGCEFCFRQLKEMKTIHFILIDRKRPEPAIDLYHQYQQELNEVFELNMRFKKISSFFNTFRILPNNIPPLGIRLAGAVAILVIGVLIGEMIFKPSQKSEQVIIEPTIATILGTQSELKLINSYFSDSEALLLEILNSNLEEELEDKSFFLSKELAQKLLMQTFLIREIALKLDNPQILNFLTNLEFLLYNIANSNEDEIMFEINEIQEMIKDAKLLKKARLFQELFNSKTIKHI